MLGQAERIRSYFDAFAGEYARGRERELSFAAQKGIAGLPPARRLYFLAVYRPEAVTRDLLVEAAATRIGGGHPVLRAPDAAWALFEKALADVTIQKRLAGAGVDLFGGGPEIFQAYIKEQLDNWTALIKDAGIEPAA